MILKQFARGLAPLACCVAVVSGVEVLAQQAYLGEGIPTSLLSPRPGLNVGRFNFHGGISSSIVYDDNVRITGEGGEEDVTWITSPYGTVQTEGPNARSLLLTYRPSFLVFLDNSDLNRVNHSGNFTVLWPLNRLSLSLHQNVSVASQVVRDIGNRATEKRYSTQLTGDYELSHRTSLQGDVLYVHSDYGAELISYDQWIEQLWTDYHFTAKLSAGAGLALSQTLIEDAPSQFSQTPGLRASFRPSPRLNLTASAGLQFRQFESGRSGSVEPVLRVAGAYQLRPETSFSLQAYRAEESSGILPGQNFVATSASAAVNQLLFKRVSAQLAGGYTTAEYYAAEEEVIAERSDDYYFVRSGFNWSLTDAWGVGLFYERRVNESGGSGFGFTQNVVGLQASWGF